MLRIMVRLYCLLEKYNRAVVMTGPVVMMRARLVECRIRRWHLGNVPPALDICRLPQHGALAFATRDRPVSTLPVRRKSTRQRCRKSRSDSPGRLASWGHPAARGGRVRRSTSPGNSWGRVEGAEAADLALRSRSAPFPFRISGRRCPQARDRQVRAAPQRRCPSRGPTGNHPVLGDRFPKAFVSRSSRKSANAPACL